MNTLIAEIKDGLFGTISGLVYTTEFQKHGLPHIHVLIFLQVMLDQQGLSKGSGFVAFSTPEEASRAVSF